MIRRKTTEKNTGLPVADVCNLLKNAFPILSFIMNFNLNKFLVVGLVFLASGLPCFAETFTFDQGKSVDDYLVFPNFRPRPYLSIAPSDDGDLLTFRSDKGAGDIALFEPVPNLKTAGDEVEVVLRFDGNVTFAVFLRGESWGAPAYIVFCSPTPDGTARLHLSKTELDITQDLSAGTLAAKHKRSAYIPGEWYVLKIRVQNQSDGTVSLEADLRDIQGQDTVLQVAADDKNDPLTAPAPLGLRFFANANGGSIEIKSITTNDASPQP